MHKMMKIDQPQRLLSSPRKLFQAQRSLNSFVVYFLIFGCGLGFGITLSFCLESNPFNLKLFQQLFAIAPLTSSSSPILSLEEQDLSFDGGHKQQTPTFNEPSKISLDKTPNSNFDKPPNLPNEKQSDPSLGGRPNPHIDEPLNSTFDEPPKLPNDKQPNPSLGGRPNHYVDKPLDPTIDEPPNIPNDNPFVDRRLNPSIDKPIFDEPPNLPNDKLLNPSHDGRPNPTLEKPPNPTFDKPPNLPNGKQPNPFLDGQPHPSTEKPPNPTSEKPPNLSNGKVPNPSLDGLPHPSVDKPPNPIFDELPNLPNKQPNPSLDGQPNPFADKQPNPSFDKPANPTFIETKKEVTNMEVEKNMNIPVGVKKNVDEARISTRVQENVPKDGIANVVQGNIGTESIAIGTQDNVKIKGLHSLIQENVKQERIPAIVQENRQKLTIPINPIENAIPKPKPQPQPQRLPPSVLLKMKDDELFWRALMTSKVDKNLQEGRVPKVAFMFLVRGILPLAPLWDKFFRGHEGRYSIYVHTQPSFKGEVAKERIFHGRRIPSKRVEWGKINMVEAERRLLANALLDTSNERFVLLSEACIPLYNFPTIYSYLINSTKTFVEATDVPGPVGRGRYNKRMMPTVTLEQWRKGSQWFEVDRTLALEIIADRKYFPLFKRFCKPACYSDEHYIPTYLSIKFWTMNSNRTLHWVDWSKGGPHPNRFGAEDLTVEFLQFVRYGTNCTYNDRPTNMCALFARKFMPSALSRLMELSSTVMNFDY